MRVDWDKFVPGASVFVPCVDTVECARQVKFVADQFDWILDVRTVIEGGRWGVRFWRIV